MSRKQGNSTTILVLLGLALLALDLTGVLGLVSADYWNHDFVKNYRGYDIYYFPGPGGLYGVDTLGTNPPGDSAGWAFYGSVAGAEGAIDNWIDDPNFIETYGDYDIFQEPAGVQRFYGVNTKTGEQTSYWTDLDGLKAYIDTFDKVSLLGPLGVGGIGLVAVGLLLGNRKVR